MMEDKVLLTRNGKSFIPILKKDTKKIEVARENGFRDPSPKELEKYLEKVGLTKEAIEPKEIKPKETQKSAQQIAQP